MFWYPKKTLQSPASAEKGELYAGQPPARVCPIWLTINGRTPFFLPLDPLKTGSLQAGFVSMSSGCSVNFSRIPWKAGSDFLAMAMALLTPGGGGADPLSVLPPGSVGSCTHTQHTGNTKCFTLPCMRRRMVSVTLRPPSDTFPSFVFILALYLQYLKVASFFFFFSSIHLINLQRERKKKKKKYHWVAEATLNWEYHVVQTN